MSNLQLQTETTVQTASLSDSEHCYQTLTLAFEADPVARWVWPNHDQFQEVFPKFAQAFAGAAFVYGTAHYLNDFAGVALWLPPGETPNEESVIEILQETVSNEKLEAVFSMFSQMDNYHPNEPHWYLPLIGVDPQYQGKGYGTALLRHTLQECDNLQMLAYLEASSSQNVPLYKRHGFEIIGKIQSSNTPQLTPMLRKPRKKTGEL